MRNNLLKVIFALFFLVIFLSEGLELLNGRIVAFYLLLAFPFALFLIHLINRKPFFLPKGAIFPILLFILFSSISTVDSLDVISSYKYLLFYISLFFIFLFVLNNKEEFKNITKKLVIILSFIFSIYSLIYLFDFGQKFLLPESGYQFIYSKFGSHNHLGDFLALTLLLNLYMFITTKKSLYILLCIFFLPFFILSFSRSAYFSFIVSSLLMLWFFLKRRKINLFSYKTGMIMVVAATSLLFFFISVREARQIPVLREGNQFLIKNFGLENKYFRAWRLEFAKQAFFSIKEKPFFGVGPGNFPYVSKEYTSISNHTTDSSHNIFLDILTENGIFAFIAFIVFLWQVFKSSSLNIDSFLFIALLINFQTDYTHTIYSFITLFFVLAALSYEKVSREKSVS